MSGDTSRDGATGIRKEESTVSTRCQTGLDGEEEAPNPSEAAHDTSTPPIAPTATLPVEFRVECHDTEPGQNLFIVGSVPELGRWDPKKAIQCTTTTSDFPMWTSPNISFATPGKNIQFKMIIQNEKLENPRWEDCANNHILELPTGGLHAPTIVSFVWGKEEVSIHPKTASFDAAPLKAGEVQEEKGHAKEAPNPNEGVYDTSIPSIAPTVPLPVEFHVECECSDTEPGQKLFIVGSVPELGGWDPKKAIQCTRTTSDFPTWTSPNISFATLDQNIQFKMMIQNETLENPRWEDCANRILELPAGGLHDPIIVSCAWGREEVFEWIFVKTASFDAAPLEAEKVEEAKDFAKEVKTEPHEWPQEVADDDDREAEPPPHRQNEGTLEWYDWKTKISEIKDFDKNEWFDSLPQCDLRIGLTGKPKSGKTWLLHQLAGIHLVATDKQCSSTEVLCTPTLCCKNLNFKRGLCQFIDSKREQEPLRDVGDFSYPENKAQDLRFRHALCDISHAVIYMTNQVGYSEHCMLLNLVEKQKDQRFRFTLIVVHNLIHLSHIEEFQKAKQQICDRYVTQGLSLKKFGNVEVLLGPSHLNSRPMQVHVFLAQQCQDMRWENDHTIRFLRKNLASLALFPEEQLLTRVNKAFPEEELTFHDSGVRVVETQNGPVRVEIDLPGLAADATRKYYDVVTIENHVLQSETIRNGTVLLTLLPEKDDSHEYNEVI